MLVVESIFTRAFGGLDWLPRTVLTAVAQGGNDELGYIVALALAMTYVAVGLAAAFVVGWQRDITD